MQAPVDVWDTILAASVQAVGDTTTSRRYARAVLRLIREPRARHLTRFPRKLAMVDASLRAKLRSLVTGEADWPLFLHGPAGTGKTCASLVLLDHVETGGYYTAAGLCATVIEAQQGRLFWTDYATGVGERRAVSPEKVWRRLGDEHLTVLDEIGCRQHVTDFHYETVKRVLDDRFGLPLVCVSNLSPGQLAEVYDDRIASRLSAGTVVELGGNDRRLER